MFSESQRVECRREDGWALLVLLREPVSRRVIGYKTRAMLVRIPLERVGACERATCWWGSVRIWSAKAERRVLSAGIVMEAIS